MQPIVLDYRGYVVNADIDPDTREVTFRDSPVTGKMWLIRPGSQYVEVFERSGKYFLELAA